MEKLPMCRICLAENIRMYKVVNRNLHELYEKLTDIPFVTEDSRPILACFFCYAKLKQCYRLLRQCLEAEELFSQRMNEDYEPNPLKNQDRLQLSSGFIKSPIEHISIYDEYETGSTAIKEELPAVCEGLDDVIEPKEEPQSDELELEHLDNSYLDVAVKPPHHSESDLEDEVPLIELKTEVEDEEVSKKKRRVRDTKSTLIKCSFSRMYIFEIWSTLSGKAAKKHQDQMSKRMRCRAPAVAKPVEGQGEEGEVEVEEGGYLWRMIRCRTSEMEKSCRDRMRLPARDGCKNNRLSHFPPRLVKRMRCDLPRHFLPRLPRRHLRQHRPSLCRRLLNSFLKTWKGVQEHPWVRQMRIQCLTRPVL